MGNLKLFLLAILLVMISSCAAYPTTAIRMNAASLTDGLTKLVSEGTPANAPLVSQLAKNAATNEAALGAPKQRLDVNDIDALEANRKGAQADAEGGNKVLAWILGIGGIAAGAFGAGPIKKWLAKAAEKAGSAKV